MSFLDQLRNPAPVAPTPAAGAGTARGFEQAVIEAETDNVRRATEGTRNATLNTAAFNLAQLMPPDAWEAQLQAAARECGLDEREALQTIASAVRGAARNPRPAHRLPSSGRPSGPVQALPELGQYTDMSDGLEPAWPAPVDWKAVWDNPAELEWIIEPIIPAGRYIALYSPPKVGKSLLMLELAVAIANGRPALGAPTRQTRVLYIDRENDVQTDVKERLQAMGHEYGDLDNVVYYEYLLDMPDLDSPEGGHYLLGLARHHKAGLVIIDTISRFITGEENDNNTWLKLHKHSAIPLKAEGITLMRLDHSGKDIDRGQRGGSAKLGDIDLCWRMTEVTPKTSYLLHCEAARIPLIEDSLNLTREQIPLAHKVDTRHINEVREESILAALAEAGVPLDAGRVQCSQALRAKGYKIRNQRLADIVKRRRMGLT